MSAEFLIVGSGIAGSILSDHLLKSGRTVTVIDKPDKSNSSRVAGGLYNPITGRKMVKTWNCDLLFDYLIPYYDGLEEELKSRFFIDKHIYRPFFNVEEQNEWMGRSSDDKYAPYIQEVCTKPTYDEVDDPFGGLLLKRSGYLDTATFLEACRDSLDQAGHLIQEEFLFDKLVLKEQGFEYDSRYYENIIFCDGRVALDNPFFSWLPFSMVKGELLFIKTDVLPRVIHNRGVFVIPMENGLMKCGSTYDHDNLDENPTKKKREELNTKVSKLMNFQYQIVDQKAGVRPASKDRKPFIGQHPEIINMWTFNGFGTKGVSLAPFYAQQFVSHLNNRAELDKEVNIKRYFSLF